jgi:hypothetical protein
MKIRLLCLAIFQVIVLFGFESVKACVCFAPTPTCRTYATAEVVFVAKVLTTSICFRR